VILKSEIYNFHRLDLTRQAGFIVIVYDEDGLKLAITNPCATPIEAFAEARKIVDNKIEVKNKLRPALQMVLLQNDPCLAFQLMFGGELIDRPLLR
jgi:hypothetical protein